MQDVEERLTTWARRSTPATRRLGPTVSDLGGIEEVLASSDLLARGPLLPYVVQATAHFLRDSGVADSRPLLDLVLAGVREQQSHAAFCGATDALTQYPALARALGPPLAKALYLRLRAAVNAGDDLTIALIGAEAADCLVQLTLAGVTPPARLLGAMYEVAEDPAALPEDFAARLPRLLGVLDAHHPNAGLRDVLQYCLGLDHTCRDAAFELALGDLRQALGRDSYDSMASDLRVVCHRFAEVLVLDPDRLDARLYHCAIDALLSLGSPDASIRVPAAATTLHETLSRYRVWRRRTRTPSWAASRQSDITAWAEMTLLLEAAATHLADDDPWYGDGHRILVALLRAYTAHQTVTVLTDTPSSSVVETMVAPVVEDAFLRHEHRVNFLRYALENDEEFRDDPAAQRLHVALRRPAHGDGSSSPPEGQVDRGKVRWRLLAETVPEGDFNEFKKNIKPEALDRLEIRLRDKDDVIAGIEDPKYSRLLERLRQELETSRDWLPDIADSFHVLLETTVRFAYRCYEVGRTMGGSYTEYLRGRDREGKKQKVDEALFHQHYRQYLSDSSLHRIANAEVIDQAGGRADILISFPKTQFNVECKIEDNDATADGLRRYVHQAAEYQKAKASFAILLALDKTVGAEGAVNLIDSIWIEHVQREGEQEPCNIVVIRVPGGRENPNRLHPRHPE
ncbi:hypothetical protein ACG83_39450 [Frankia sp. R43]|uniref:hypothetical protein n=1 Tax=Frankia sp. R43 TaxID=269536 RepID=UPI0006C9FD26|nr:hypothetical protein [Frankia sp. R43]KPM50616.1 hypothetical protein ACG83_39450 [Frankia sp. R43]